jgi:RNA polymerase sigma factor (sigma-70 family)
VGLRGPAGGESAEERYRRLYDAHVAVLLAYAVRRVDQPGDAADVVAETMLVAWRRRATVPSGDEARLWLFGVARMVLANHRRGAQRRDRLSGRLRHELVEQIGPDHAPATETTLVVRAALDRLDETDREILHLTAWEGLNPQEIATVLAIPAGTVRTRLHRARNRLRIRLAAADVTSPDGADASTGERTAPGGHVSEDGRLLVPGAEEDR